MRKRKSQQQQKHGARKSVKIYIIVIEATHALNEWFYGSALGSVEPLSVIGHPKPVIVAVCCIKKQRGLCKKGSGFADTYISPIPVDTERGWDIHIYYTRRTALGMQECIEVSRSCDTHAEIHYILDSIRYICT